MSEWRDLPTLPDVAAAQAAGDEIEVKTVICEWKEWAGKTWLASDKYRARAKPNVRNIKVLGWIDPDNGETLTRREDFQVETMWGWIRYSKLDDEVEVPL